MAGKKDAIGDMNKPRLSLIPKSALWALGGALTYGEKHYGTNNWRKGIPVTELLDAAMRHIIEYGNGENIDKKSKNHHLGNAMANLSMIIELESTMPEMDDRHNIDKYILPKSRKEIEGEIDYDAILTKFVDENFNT